MVKKTGQPGYLQIADDLREQIRGGALAPGDPLPSTARLAEQYVASLSVVKMAVGILRNEGLLIGQQGKGVFVREAGEGDPVPGGDVGEQLTEIRATLRDLSERLAQVEAELSKRRS
ncbi:GntR family transcriptional regulator [Nonomuraea rhizosphaerae]|uniref:GntR family transcriptional regulator n=1 Tax=Nonomuraea rhizosphaerae TaxID=2665663 RepID=UPI001C5DEB34|nr:winged helix-turn-helix domain-containing protein [Nonomuraea rhizosphaerae]